MTTASNPELVRDILLKALTHISGYDETGLDETAGDRLIDIEEEKERLVIQFASDGLGLSQKLAIETLLKKALEEAIGDKAETCVFYFKRTQAPDTAGAGLKNYPRPPEQMRSGPFGIKQNKRAIPGVRRVLAVTSGKGGVGKSTVSVNLAVALAREGQRVGLLDADIYGPSAPTMLGLGGPVAVSSQRKMIPHEAFGVKCVSFGFLSDAKNPVIWRGPMVAKALQQLFYETEWGDLDYLILDLPPGTGDVQLTMIEKLPLYGGLIVSTPQDVALLDAHKGLSMFRRLSVPVLGIVENMAVHVCSNCSHEEAIFGDGLESFAEKEKISILAKFPLLIHIRQGGDTGQPIALSDHPVAAIFSALSKKVMEL